MACFNPLVAYRGKHPNAKTGKLPMVFSPRDSLDPDSTFKLPCGRCIGCRLEKSRQWAIRCVHEAALYERNCFITLTFSDENLPKSGSLDKRDFQLFMKSLRKRFYERCPVHVLKISSSVCTCIRYFHCGEYGEKYGRPHYHACLFNFDFNDKELWSVRDGVKLFRSRSLEKLWPFGFSTIGDVTFESAAYVARYVTKKITGPRAEDHYWRYDQKTGECYDLQPEYTTMSRRPGIGRGYLEKFEGDIYPHDRVILRGKELRPPKYYDNIFELANPEEFEEIKDNRKRKQVSAAKDNEYDRLRVRERHQEINLTRLKRSLESET